MTVVRVFLGAIVGNHLSRNIERTAIYPAQGKWVTGMGSTRRVLLL